MTPSDPMPPAAWSVPPATGERLLARIKPHPLYIVLDPMWTLVLLLGATWASAWVWARLGASMGLRDGAGAVWGAGLLAMAARIAWQAAEWLARDYALTDRRIIACGGVVRRWMVEVPLARVQHTQVSRLLRERLTGLGTIGVASAGTAGVELVWVMIPRPLLRLGEIRAAAAAAAGGKEPA